MFKAAAESGECSWTENSWRAESVAQRLHTEQRIEVCRGGVTGIEIGSSVAAVAVRRKRAAQI
jgi:hypothetical protein